jgi:hypothetical protein
MNNEYSSLTIDSIKNCDSDPRCIYYEQIVIIKLMMNNLIKWI